MRKKNPPIAILLVLVVGIILCACSENDEIATGDSIVYAAENVTFTSDLQYISSGCVIGDTVYLLGKANDRASGYQLQRFPLEGGEAETLPNYQGALPSEDGFAILGRLRAGTDGTLWVMERLMLYSKEVQEFHILRNLDTDGKELARFEYSSLEEKLGLGTVTNLLIDSDGAIFAEADQGVALLDETGTAQFIIKEARSFSGKLVLLGNGQIGVTRAIMDAPGEYTYSLHLIDKDAKGLGEGWTLVTGTPSLVSIYGGDTDTLFYYQIGDSLLAWQEGAKEGEQLLNLVDLGVENYSPSIFQLADGRLVLLITNYGNSTETSLYLLIPTDASLAQDKKVLTLASLQLVGTFRDAVIEFNRTDPDYRISVTDYSQYGGREAAMTRFATEIGAGKMPDILDLYGIPVSRWAANGLLEDLWSYIDRDSDISRDGLMERVFQAAEIDGKLYQIGQYFWISTLTGAKSVVGDRMTWTGADMWKALEAMPEDCRPTADSRSTMLRSLMGLDWSRFVDWENSTCSFESEEFKTLLQFCAGFPADIAPLEERAAYEDQQMLLSHSITGFEFPQRAKFLLGGDISYIGYPNEWSEVGSSFSFVSSMAMSSACRDKEGAWTFLRTLLLPHNEAEMQAGAYNYFPVNKVDFQKAAEQAMTPEYATNGDGAHSLDKNGERVETWKSAESFDGIAEDCWYYATTQEEYDQLMALYNAIDTYNRWDPDLESIIMETAGAYFAGDKSLDETAALIQNRASLYVNEQT